VPKDNLEALVKAEPDQPSVIIAAGNFCPTTLRQQVEHYGGIFACINESTRQLTDTLTEILNPASKTVTSHGVMMVVHDMGILITGIPDIGKSELALELLTRGHQLVADDAPGFYLSKTGKLIGFAPALLYGFLEVRGLGIIDVQAIFGKHSVCNRKRLHLVIQLKRISDQEMLKIDRLHGDVHQQTLLGVKVDCLTIPVATGRNLAVLVETAAHNHKLKLQGYNAAERFIELQTKQIEKNQK
jgi:HPr kinase/phosphorylase